VLFESIGEVFEARTEATAGTLSLVAVGAASKVKTNIPTSKRKEYRNLNMIEIE
jgi:hypothetical protein